jgi:hypothetical protein
LALTILVTKNVIEYVTKSIKLIVANSVTKLKNILYRGVKKWAL